MDLQPFSIGPVRVDMPAFLPGMAGYTDLPYRLICRRQGARYAVTEMMLDRLLLLPGKLRGRLVRLTDEDHPVAGQLIGNEPAVMGAAAAALGEMGFDVVDLNFACPVRKALRRRRGGYLMKEPPRALEIVRAVLAAASTPVTVKLRRAFDHDDGTNDAFRRIAEGAFDAGAAAICVHARSVEQKYAGSADWEFLADVKRHFADRTVLGSGDVRTPGDALEMLRRTGVDAVAAARGALGNPWFFRQVRDLAEGRPPYGPGLSEQRALLEGHFAHAGELYGRRAPKIMRHFGIKYARLHPTPAQVRAAFVKVRSEADWRSVLEEFYRA